MPDLSYIHLPAGSALPNLPTGRWKIITITEQDVSAEWRGKVTDWLVAKGCLYSIPWGVQCSEWDDGFDGSFLKANNYVVEDDDKFVMTTWHENETLEETLWFAKVVASPPSGIFDGTLIVHVALQGREGALLAQYHAVN